MNVSPPVFFSAGLFDSHQKFGDAATSEPRHVPCYELEYFTEDGGTAYINGSAYPIRKGYVLLGRPGDVRHSRFPFKCRFIHFELAPELQMFTECLKPYFPCPDKAKVELYFTSIANLFYSSDTADTIAAASQLLVLLHLLKSNPPSRDHHILAKADSFIEEHYADPLPVTHIAKHCGVSVAYLHRLYVNEVGYGPHQAVLNRRITAAKQMLLNSDQTLNDIAFACGFTSQSYFSDCFKRCVGCTPRDFRKNHEYTP